MTRSMELLNKLLHEHPLMTVFKAIMATDFMPERDTVVHRFHHISLDGESLTFFTRNLPMRVYFSLSDDTLGAFYVNLFQDAHREFKIAETGEE